MLNKPLISANKLGEYIVSRSARQRRILHDRKYPDPDFNIGMYHREAAEAVTQYILGGAIDTSPLDTALGMLEQQTPQKIGTVRRISSNIDSIERFNNMLDDIDLKGATPEAGTNAAPKIEIYGVEISVRPEIILRQKIKGKQYLGALKLHFSKTNPHIEDSANFVSVILNEYCKRNIALDEEVVNPILCQVIDVASGKVFPGVKSLKRRLDDIEAACRNINALWQSI